MSASFSPHLPRMHHALEIQEILSNIFAYCHTSDLALLARTCRAFKEPALGVLWEELPDLSPLARCIPDASRQSSSEEYSFSRPLTQTDWTILRSYARRIRSVRGSVGGVDWEPIVTPLNSPTAEPLFPNLRHLHHSSYTEKTMSLLRLPLPSLLTLRVAFQNSYLFQNSLDSFPKFSPNIRILCIFIPDAEDPFYSFEPNYVARWQSLYSLVCFNVTLDMDDLVHLSRMPMLTELSFALSVPLPASDPHLVFSNLHRLSLNAEPLVSISWFLSHIRLPTLTSFYANIRNSPSKRGLASFMASIATCNTGHSIECLVLKQSYDYTIGIRRLENLPLGLEDLRPCMSFNNMHFMELDIECNVGLTDNEVLALASAWPRLEHLCINASWGWCSDLGLTPTGLVRLLVTCRSLKRIALAIDTQGYTTMPLSQAAAFHELTLPPQLLIDVVDSIIDVESLPAVATFFSNLATCSRSYFSIDAWGGEPVRDFPEMEENLERWNYVRGRVDAALGLPESL